MCLLWIISEWLFAIWMIIWQNWICFVTEVRLSKHCRRSLSFLWIILSIFCCDQQFKKKHFCPFYVNTTFAQPCISLVIFPCFRVFICSCVSLCVLSVCLSIFIKAPSPVNAMWAKGSKYVINLLNKTVAETLKWNILPVGILLEPPITLVTFSLYLGASCGVAKRRMAAVM